MKSTETRLSMRKATEINKFHMSMDNAMRSVGANATRLAISGGEVGADSLLSTNAFADSMIASLPTEIQAATNNGTVKIGVGVESYPLGTTIPDLMNTPVEYEIMRAESTRANIYNQGRNFAGRRWGMRSTTTISLMDNLAPLRGSWYRRAESVLGQDTGRTLGATESGESILAKGISKNIVLVTEIPSQFSIQGQNMVVRKTGNTDNKIGMGGDFPTILGKNVALDPDDIRLDSERRIITRARLDEKNLHGAGTSLRDRAHAGAAKEQELEAAGSILMIPVGTRGPEIFRPPGDYITTLNTIGHLEQKKAATNTTHLNYWLPYYQCNIRTEVRVPAGQPPLGSNPAVPETNLNTDEFFQVGTRFADTVDIPAAREVDSPQVPAGFENINALNEPVNRFGRSVLSPATSTPPTGSTGIVRPISVVSRHHYTQSTGTSKWINTIDVDVEKLMQMVAATGTSDPALAIHIDIRGPNGEFLPNAADFPVVLRQSSRLSMPVSIVTPGTLYLQGPFASVASISGKKYPYSLMAPKIRYGMVSRTPASVGVNGQRHTVGGADSDAMSDPLAIVSGAETAPLVSSNNLANTHQSALSIGPLAQVPPVHLKDWIVETFNIWVDQ